MPKRFYKLARMISSKEWERITEGDPFCSTDIGTYRAAIDAVKEKIE